MSTPAERVVALPKRTLEESYHFEGFSTRASKEMFKRILEIKGKPPRPLLSVLIEMMTEMQQKLNKINEEKESQKPSASSENELHTNNQISASNVMEKEEDEIWLEEMGEIIPREYLAEDGTDMRNILLNMIGFKLQCTAEKGLYLSKRIIATSSVRVDSLIKDRELLETELMKAIQSSKRRTGHRKRGRKGGRKARVARNRRAFSKISKVHQNSD